MLSRLRASNGWPRIDAIAITHFHLDHWGDLVPWVWGSMYRGQEKPLPKPELWVFEGGRSYLENLGTRLGFPDMFDRAFVLHEYRGGEPFAAGGFEVLALRLPHYTLETYGFRVTGDGRHARVLGRLGAERRASSSSRATPTSSSARRRSSAPSSTASCAATSTPRRRSTPSPRRRARLLLTHRPVELPLDDGLEQAYDGLALTIAPRVARSADSASGSRPAP